MTAFYTLNVTDSRTTRMEGGHRLRETARPTPPLVSIITVIFRAAQELPPLFESIMAHRGEDTEWIVIDGGSDDGTLEILRRFDHSIDYWLSEADRGIYDAMNKGIAAATGEFVLHLNAGDRLKCIPRESLQRCLAERIDVACFSVDMEGWGEFRPRTGFLMRIDNIWHHQGAFYKRQSHPGYDLRYRILSDFDCNQKILKAGKSVALFRQVVAEQATVGVSNSKAADEEKNRIIRENFGVRFAALAIVWKSLEGPRLWLKYLLTCFESRRK